MLVGKAPPELANASPTMLYENRDGLLLLGTSVAGLYSFDGTAFTHVKGVYQTVLSMTEDREGNLWVGTRGGGLTQLRPRTVDLLPTSATAPFEAVRSVAQDAAGLLWAVVWQKGVVLRSAGEGWEALSAKDGWPFTDAQCVVADLRCAPFSMKAGSFKMTSTSRISHLPVANPTLPFPVPNGSRHDPGVSKFTHPC